MRALRISSGKKEGSSEWLIDNIADASKNARGIYLLYIGFLAYCALTVVSTKDRQIILNEGVHLPIVGLDISLIDFFIVAPLIAIFIFIYLQLYLKRLIGLIADFRIKYQSADRRRLYPWMINIAIDPEDGIIGKLQKTIVNISLFWFLPIVLFLFPLWFLKKHDPCLTCIIGLFPLIGTAIVIWFWYHYAWCPLIEFIKKNISIRVLGIIVFSFEMLFYLYMKPTAFDGSVKSGFLRDRLYVDLSYQKLINEQNVEYETLYWVNLNGAQLQGANLRGSILKKADLRGAQLQGADLKWAMLQLADLSHAQLDGANLSKAQLQGAILNNAHLEDAILYEAQLQGADLTMAHLQGADIRKAQLQGADLRKACFDEDTDLREAMLQGVDISSTPLDTTLIEEEPDSASSYNAENKGANNITLEQLSKVKTLYNANLDDDIKKEIEEKYPHLLEKPKD